MNTYFHCWPFGQLFKFEDSLKPGFLSFILESSPRQDVSLLTYMIIKESIPLANRTYRIGGGLAHCGKLEKGALFLLSTLKTYVWWTRLSRFLA